MTKLEDGSHHQYLRQQLIATKHALLTIGVWCRDGSTCIDALHQGSAKQLQEEPGGVCHDGVDDIRLRAPHGHAADHMAGRDQAPRVDPERGGANGQQLRHDDDADARPSQYLTCRPVFIIACNLQWPGTCSTTDCSSVSLAHQQQRLLLRGREGYSRDCAIACSIWERRAAERKL